MIILRHPYPRMQALLDFIGNLTDPQWITQHGGLFLVAFIVFAETGLFVGFFLPGDYLLFITGMIIANSQYPFESNGEHLLFWLKKGGAHIPLPFDMDPGVANLFFWITLIVICGVLGNMVGYWFGKKSGPLLFERRETWLFKRKYLVQAQAFYEKRGGGAIVIARFLPLVRTFAPIVAGVVKMDRKKFMFYNLVGCIAWVVSMTVTGYLLGTNEWVKNNLEKIVIGLVLVTTGPVIYRMFFHRKK